MRFCSRILRRALAIFLVSQFATNAYSADGHCSYVQHYARLDQKMKVCKMPANEKTCKEPEAAYARGACRTESVIGVCKVGRSRLVYYEGNPLILEIGCEKQKGVWHPQRKSIPSRPFQ